MFAKTNPLAVVLLNFSDRRIKKQNRNTVQKLWLKDFEFQLGPNTWNSAQDLIQAGAVRNLQEVEKNFWVARVADGEFEYETETIITPRQIKAFTCECWPPGRRMMCTHIAAALFKVRQFLEQKAKDRQAKAEAEQREKAGRLTVQNLLDSVSPGDLADFVRNYARYNRDFALALKTHFAGNLPEAENPFLLVLDAALPRHLGTRWLLAPEMRRLLKTLDDLDLQITAAAESAHANRVFQIAAAVLQRTRQVVPKSTGASRERLLRHIRGVLKRLLDLSAEYLSPELRENRRKFLLDYLLLPEPGAPWAEELIVPFLASEASDSTFFGDVQTVFDQAATPAPPVVLHLFLAGLAQRKLPEAALRVLREYVAWPAQIKDAIATLHRLHYWEAALIAGEYFLENNLFGPGQRRELEDMLLLAAEKAGDRPRHTAYLRQRYRQHGLESVLQRLKIVAGPEWPGEVARLLEELQKAGDEAKIAQVLAAEGDFDALTGLLKKHGDLNLLRQYEHLFGPAHAGFVRDMYLDSLATYLADHFGKQASGYVREQLIGLVYKGQAELAKTIVSGLVGRFPDRTTLPAELAEIFPKPKRIPALPVPGEV